MTGADAVAAPAGVQQCQHCGFRNGDAMLYCGMCGQPLAGRFATQQRRRLTVLFCDLVGSTALSGRMDMEDFEDLLGRYKAVCTAAARAYRGYVARYVGDALLVYFGYPQALEDAPAQAARAALAIVASVATLEGRDSLGQGFVPAVRVGIATGDVVVGNLVGRGWEERDAVHGHAANVAAKLHGAAQPNTVLIAEETRRALPPEFELEELGPVAIPGLPEAVAVYRVLAERTAPPGVGHGPRYGGAAIGRDVELARLERLWALAFAGGRAVAVIRGEPGIGKTRLTREIAERARGGHAADGPARGRARVLWLACSPAQRNSAFHPLAEALRRTLWPGPTPAPSRLLARVRRVVRAVGLPASAATPVAELLTLDPDAAPPRPLETALGRRERLLTALSALLRRWVAGGALLVVIDDAHWIDPSSQDAITALFGRLPDLPCLCVATCRAEQPTPWLDALAPEAFDLGRLDAANSAGLALGVGGAARLPAAVLTRIVERAEGVPLFIEELTRNALEARDSPDAEFEPGSVPGSLRESLAARLDRMADGKAVAQIASVLGRRFSRALLEQVAPLPPRRLAAGLAQLLAAGLVTAERDGEGEHFTFRHALVRDTAYSTLLLRIRRGMHRDVAAALLRSAGSLAEARPEIVAQHLTHAEQWSAAASAWLQAGQRAQARLELSEAAMMFRNGLNVVANVPGAEARRAAEMALQAGHAVALMPSRGYGAPEVREAFARVQELCGEALDAWMFPHLWSVWSYQFAACVDRLGEAAADRLALIAAAAEDRTLVMMAHTAQCATRGALGDLAGSERAARAAIALYDPARDRALALTYAVDSRLLSMLFLHHVLWIQGRAEAAAAIDAACVAAARDLGHDFLMPAVLIWGGAPLVYADRHAEALDRMAEGVRLARAGRFDLWGLTGEAWHAAALIGSGALAEGAAKLEAALRLFDATGVRLSLRYLDCVLATALCRLGRHADALALCEAAVAACDGLGLPAAEVHRMFGDVLLAGVPAQPDRAREHYRIALTIARRQGARVWAARAEAALAALA